MESPNMELILVFFLLEEKGEGGEEGREDGEDSV